MRSRTRPTNCWNPSQTSAAQKTFNAIDAKNGHGNIFVSTRNWNARDLFFFIILFFLDGWKLKSIHTFKKPSAAFEKEKKKSELTLMHSDKISDFRDKATCC